MTKSKKVKQPQVSCEAKLAVCLLSLEAMVEAYIVLGEYIRGSQVSMKTIKTMARAEGIYFDARKVLPGLPEIP